MSKDEMIQKVLDDNRTVADIMWGLYTQGIDDFANKMIETMDMGYMYTETVINNIAEQLKAGGKNE